MLRYKCPSDAPRRRSSCCRVFCSRSAFSDSCAASPGTMPIKRPKGEKCAVGGFGKDRRTADFDDGRGVPSAGGQPACLAVQTPKGSKPWHGQLDSLQVACLGIVGGGPWCCCIGVEDLRALLQRSNAVGLRLFKLRQDCAPTCERLGYREPDAAQEAEGCSCCY